MKHCHKKLFLVLSCAITLASTSAFAATWTAGERTIRASQDIERVVIDQGATDYTFSMYLKGTPTLTDNRTIYGIYMTRDSTQLEDIQFSNNFDFYVETQVNRTPRNTLAFSTNTINGSSYSFTTSNNMLQWSIPASQLNIQPFYFAGATFGSNLKAIDQTAVAATPIPGTAWLFVSGILGLVGLKRKKQLKLA